MLTTSVDSEPRQQQLIDHVRQSDGSHVARGKVTLFSTTTPPPAGLITVQNPSGEVVTLTINAAESEVQPQTPKPSEPQAPVTNQTPQSPTIGLLTLSDATLTFPAAIPGEYRFLVFTVSQQNVNTPVTLTVDSPVQFQLATDSQPNFVTSLTFVPAPRGSYVHVRYTPDKAGWYQAKLTVETPYVNKVISLIGQSSGFKGLAFSLDRRWKIGLPVVVLLGALTVTGYSYRCQLLPDLCQEPVENASTAPFTEPPVATQTNRTADSIAAIPSTASISRRSEPAPVSEPEPEARPALTPTAKPASPTINTDEPVSKAPTVTSEKTVAEVRTARPPSLPSNSKMVTPKKKTVEPAKAVSAPAKRPAVETESDLERELNRKPGS